MKTYIIKKLNVIAIKNSNLEGLKAKRKILASKKEEISTADSLAAVSEMSVAPAPSLEPKVDTPVIDFESPSAPTKPIVPVDTIATMDLPPIAPPTNADLLASTLASPGFSAAEQVAPVIPVAPMIVQEPSISEEVSTVENSKKDNLSGDLVLEIISKITKMQGELDEIGERVIQISTLFLEKSNNKEVISEPDNILPAPELLEQTRVPAGPDFSVLPNREISPFDLSNPSGNIFDEVKEEPAKNLAA